MRNRWTWLIIYATVTMGINCSWEISISDINWTNWTSASNSDSSFGFLNCLGKNFLTQHVLDLVISDDTVVANIEMLGPLGKSDHAVLEIHCSLDVCIRHFTAKYNYIKGDYVRLRSTYKSTSLKVIRVWRVKSCKQQRGDGIVIYGTAVSAVTHVIT